MVTTSGNLFHIDFGHFLGNIKYCMVSCQSGVGRASIRRGVQQVSLLPHLSCLSSAKGCREELGGNLV